MDEAAGNCCCCSYILASIAAFIGFVYLCITWNNGYWKKRNIPYKEPKLIYGNIKDIVLQKRHMADVMKEYYQEFKDYKYFGFFKMMTPALFIRDPELVKSILMKNFNSFHDNDIEVDEKIDPIFANNPFCLKGEKWKILRNHVTSCLTISKIKAMFPLMEEVTKKMINFIATSPSDVALDTKEIAANFTTDVVASCTFAIDGKSFEEPNSIFRKMFKLILADDDRWSSVKFFIIMYMPTLSRLLRLRLIKEEVVQFFGKLSADTMKERRQSGIVRNDYLDSIIKLQDKHPDITNEIILSHIIMFFTEGIETSAITMSFTLYELAAHPEVFKTLREEVDEVLAKHGGNITYEAINDMPYLECVLSETLRFFLPLPAFTKLCTEEFKLPNCKGEGPELTVKVGTTIVLPAHALQCDPKYFPNPSKFDPDRFKGEVNIDKGTYFPFGEGPRQCLGSKFAQTQVKTALVAIVKNFDLKVNPKMIVPIQHDPLYSLMSAKGGIWLNFSKRKSD